MDCMHLGTTRPGPARVAAVGYVTNGYLRDRLPAEITGKAHNRIFAYRRFLSVLAEDTETT